MNMDVKDLLGRINLRDPVSIGGVVSLVVATILFGVTARSLVLSFRQRAELQASYDGVQDAIARAQQARTMKPGELREEIAEAQGRLRQALSDFPSTAQANEELSSYYRHADELGAQLVRMEAIAADWEEEGESIYSVQRFLLEAEGEVPNLLRFLSRVGGGPYVTFLVEDVTIRSDGVPVASADLTVFASDLGAGATPRLVKRLSAPVPATTPLVAEGEDLLRLESQMIMAMAAREWPAAVDHGRRILAESPGRPGIVQALYQSHVSWAHDLVAQGRGVEAREQFEAALEFFPQGEEALEGLRQLGAAAEPAH